MKIVCENNSISRNVIYINLIGKLQEISGLTDEKLQITFVPIVNNVISFEKNDKVNIVIPIGVDNNIIKYDNIVYEYQDSKTRAHIRLANDSRYANIYYLYSPRQNILTFYKSIQSAILECIMLDEFRNILSKKGLSYKLDNRKKTQTKSIQNMSELVMGDNSIEDIVNEMIEKVDLRSLKSVILSNLRGQSGCKDIGVTDIELYNFLKLWAISKIPYYLMFGRNLSISVKDSVEISNEILNQSINDLKFKYNKYALVLDNFTLEEYRKNIVFNVNNSLKTYGNLKRNMKLSKFISNYIEDTELDMDLSQIIQSTKLDAIFEFSIHPMDYITSATTMSGWDSCHQFFNKERAVGCISYMIDTSTVVAFVHTGKIYDYSKRYDTDLKWNSKIYRQLIHIDTYNNSMIFNRLYPQHSMNDGIKKFIREVIEEIVSDFCGIENKWKFSTNGGVGKYKFDNKCHSYDDIPHNEHHFVRHNDSKYAKIYIGKQAVCIKCLKPINIKQKRPCICYDCVKESKTADHGVYSRQPDNTQTEVAF